MRRVVGLAIAAACSASLGVAAPASAATPQARVDLHGTVVFDDGSQTTAWNRAGTATTAYQYDDALLVTFGFDSSPSVQVIPPAGGTITVGATPVSTIRQASTTILYGTPCPGSGVLDVKRVRYEGDEVVELDATFGITCEAGRQGARNRVGGLVEGTIQVGPTTTRPLVTPENTYLGGKGRGIRTQEVVVLGNRGDAPTGVLGAASLVGYASGFAVAADRCSGVDLGPGETCELVVEHTSTTAGVSSDLVVLAAPGYAGGRLFAPVSAWTADPPGAVTQVQAWPTAGGVGLNWWYAPTSLGYRVERLEGGDWVDAGGAPEPTARFSSFGRWTWVDPSVQPGQTRTYRVVATNPAGDGPPSASATLTAPAVPHLGAGEVATRYDADTDTVQPPYSAVQKGNSFRLAGYDYRPLYTYLFGAISGDLPVITGPGRYPFARAQVGTSSCSAAYLDVIEVSYRPESLAASYRADCGSGVTTGEIRIGNDLPRPQLEITAEQGAPPVLDVGATTEPLTVVVRNTGAVEAPVGAPVLRGPGRADWSVRTDRCPATLPVEGACELEVVAMLKAAGRTDARVTLAVPSGSVSSPPLAAVGASLPPAPAITSLVRTVGSVALTFDSPDGTGGLPLSSVTVHRWAAARHDTFEVPIADFLTPKVWADPAAPAGAVYAVQATNAKGAGPVGPRSSPRTSRDGALSILAGSSSGSSSGFRFAATDLDGGAFAAPVVIPGVPTPSTADLSPDGRRLLVATCDGGCRLLEAPVDGSAPARVVTSTPYPVRQVEWSPDGTRALVMWVDPGQGGLRDCVTVALVDIARGTTVVVPTERCTRMPVRMAWWPDARSFVINESSSMVRRSASASGDVIKDFGVGWNPSITPDGRWLVYATSGSNDRTLRMRAPVAGGQPVQDPTLPAGPVEWGPDGTSWLAHDYNYFGYPFTVRGRIGSAVGTAVPLTPAPDDWRHTRQYVGWTGGRVAFGGTPATVAGQVTLAFSTAALQAGATTTCSVDDGPQTACSSPFSARLADGTHMVRVTATEPGGRVSVAARELEVTSRDRDHDGDGHNDLVSLAVDGSLYIYRGDGDGGFLPRARIGVSAFLSQQDLLVAPGDWDGDGDQDLLSRRAGRLYLLPNDGTGARQAPVAYGSGWEAMTAVVGPGDWNSDGNPDLLARDTTGRLYLYRGNGRGGFLPRIAYGTGWNAMTAIVATGDVNSDGAADLMARDSTGRLHLYPGDGRGGFTPRISYGLGWNAMTAIVGAGQWDTGTTNDLLARDATGRLYLYPGDGRGGFGPRIAYGTGWNAMKLIAG